jgi:hypothetical protein
MQGQFLAEGWCREMLNQFTTRPISADGVTKTGLAKVKVLPLYIAIALPTNNKLPCTTKAVTKQQYEGAGLGFPVARARFPDCAPSVCFMP